MAREVIDSGSEWPDLDQIQARIASKEAALPPGTPVEFALYFRPMPLRDWVMRAVARFINDVYHAGELVAQGRYIYPWAGARDIAFVEGNSVKIRWLTG